MTGDTMEQYAKKTFLALKNPYHTVEKVYPNVIDKVRAALGKNGYAFYTGYKQTASISDTLMERMEAGGILTHTRDRVDLGGRAVDMQIVNPLTGRPMTGSSSGTALNVFYRINDLGVGTDGGGSVLAPAASLNLYGFISPLIEEKHMKRFRKKSTDGISFSPSAGLITRDMDTLEKAAGTALGLDLNKRERQQNREKKYLEYKLAETEKDLDIFGPREGLIEYVRDTVREGVILVSKEGPVDLMGLGDTIFGHFGQDTKKMQERSGKGLMRVANMCGVSALTVPDRGLGRCTVLLGGSRPEDIRALFDCARSCQTEPDALTERYFGNLSMYFED